MTFGSLKPFTICRSRLSGRRRRLTTRFAHSFGVVAVGRTCGKELVCAFFFDEPHAVRARALDSRRSTSRGFINGLRRALAANVRGGRERSRRRAAIPLGGRGRRSGS